MQPTSGARLRHSNSGFAIAIAIAVVAVLAARPAAASNDPLPDIEVPVIIFDELTKGDAGTSDSALDLANIVQTAAKGVTTVQAAPAIVTVVTGDEIRDRRFTSIAEAIDSVPGNLQIGAIHNQFSYTLTRGTLQSLLLMIDGVSMFDPHVNIATLDRVYPMEVVKRIETVTGPGGVLWGANSFLGIINVITKDASDVEGVETGLRAGSGPGDRESLRGYAMAGATEVLGGADLFVHTSFETYAGPAFEMPQLVFSSPLPQPNARTIYGPLTTSGQPRSMLFNLSGKLTVGDFSLSVSAPYVQRHLPLTFAGAVIRRDLEEDELRDADGNLLCDVNNPPDPPYDPSDLCSDVLRALRDHQFDFLDRYVVADYHARTAGGTAGFAVKAYATEFQRAFPQLSVTAPFPGVVEGGIANSFDFTSYRAGASVDGDIELPRGARLLYGAEGFHEWFPDRTNLSRQGAGSEVIFSAPYLIERLPLLCPQQPATDDAGQPTGGTETVPGCPMTIAFAADRTMFGAYLNPQWRLTKELTLDAGARVQVAPEALGSVGYGAEPLLSGALVYRFARDWHFKANYAQGFRAPVFNNLTSNGESVSVDGSEDIVNERSEAAQVEVNARLFKGERRLRELSLRVDYSYTRLQNLIQIVAGRYQNTADRGIHAGEVLARLFVSGGHRLELAYTWQRVGTGDVGWNRALPENWFHLTGVLQLSEELSAMYNLRVLGSMEDPNRLVEHRRVTLNDQAQVVDASTGEPGFLLVSPTDIVVDRLPPSADLTVGLTYTGIDRMELGVIAYNAFNALDHQSDAFLDFEPRSSFLPNPRPGLRFHLYATMAF